MTAGKTVSIIGDSIVIKGELIANEDLVLEGRVEGKITSNRNVLTVGEHGRVEATIVGNTVVVAGKVRGDITAAEKIDFRDTGSVEGDIAAPVVVMAPGVRFLGGIDMPQPQGAERTAARGRDRR